MKRPLLRRAASGLAVLPGVLAAASVASIALPAFAAACSRAENDGCSLSDSVGVIVRVFSACLSSCGAGDFGMPVINEFTA
ncbi:hypothetical protein D3C87_1642640 [compost metagenome]